MFLFRKIKQSFSFKKKAFTLIELLIATMILLSVFGIIVKTIFGLNQHNMRLAADIQNIVTQEKLQSFFTDNELGDILVSYMPLGDSTIYNLDYSNNDIKELIDYIVFSKDGLNIKKQITTEINGQDEIIKLPYFVFKDKNGKIGVLGFVTDNRNKDINALSLKLFYINDDYYLKTKGAYSLSDLLYFFKNKDSDANLQNKLDNYINDLKNAGIILLDKIIITDKKGIGQHLNITYLTPDDLKKSIFIIPTKNLLFSNPTKIESMFSIVFKNLGNAKLYYCNFDFGYNKARKQYSIYTNAVIK